MPTETSPIRAFARHVALDGHCRCGGDGAAVIASGTDTPLGLARDADRSSWAPGRGDRVDRGDRGDRGARVRLAGALHDRSALARTLGTGVEEDDARLIARAWERWGVATPEHLQGEYAFAVHEPDERRVILVRDHVGTHPLVWHLDGNCVRFATSMGLLLGLLTRRPEVDVDTVAAYLRVPGQLGSRTFLRGVQRVEPGHVVILGGGGVRTARWWDPAQIAQVSRTRADALDALDALVVAAVDDRLGEHGRTGVHLSGGLDSTLVATVTRERLAARGDRLQHAYAWSPPRSTLDPDLEQVPAPAAVSHAGDERPRLERLAKDLDVRLTTSSRGASAMRDLLRRPIEIDGVADVFDELPIIDAAHRDGVRVLLTGWGGDETISSHARGVPAHLVRTGRVGDAARLLVAANGGRRPLASLVHHAWGKVIVPLLPDVLYRYVPLHEDLYASGCYAASSLRADHVGMRATALEHRVTADPRADMVRLVEDGHLAERMETWSAWSAPRGVVHRYPLTDRRVMEHVLSSPPELLWSGGRPRAPARSLTGRRLTGVLSKADPANERQRLRMLRGTWMLLGDEVTSGTLDLTCDWLDVAALRVDLLRGPSGDDHADVRTMLRMMPALRVLDLFQRST